MMRNVSTRLGLIIKKGDEIMPPQIVTKKDAYDAGGFRERYAMDHGTKEIRMVNGHRLWIYTYSPDDPYQEANGTSFDCMTRRWVG